MQTTNTTTISTNTILNTHQERSYKGERKNGGTIVALVRFDDRMGNGHNTFSITASLYDKFGCEDGGGMCHEEVVAAFPELAPLVKYHLVSTDEPMHYLANTLYWLGYEQRWVDGKQGSPPNLDYARKSAVWPDMPEELVCSAPKDDAGAVELQRHHVTTILNDRLATLQNEFRAAVESIGFVW